MPEQIIVVDSELEGFTPQGRADLINSITAYKSDLLKEIGRIEAGQNAGSGVPEITSRMVKDAETIFSRGSIYQRKRIGLKVLKATAAISLFVAGAMVQKEQLKDFTYLVIFMIVVVFAITTNIFANLRD
jgi:hypothetical protein